MSHGANNQPSKETVTALRRRFSGLDKNLHFIPGRTISQKYETYKKADRDTTVAIKDYKMSADELEARKPYSDEARRRVKGRQFYQAGHQALAPKAGVAADAAEFHADRRESFNKKYKDVMEAQSPATYNGHVTRAVEARATQTDFRAREAAHLKFMKELSSKEASARR